MSTTTMQNIEGERKFEALKICLVRDKEITPIIVSVCFVLKMGPFMCRHRM